MKKIPLFILCSIISIFMACESAQKKDVETTSPTDPSGLFVASSNKQLSELPVGGFAYKSSKVPAIKWQAFAKSAAPVIKSVIDGLPAGYVLQVTGHTDSRGPEQPVGKKPGNIKISTDRAKMVHKALKAEGITSPKLTYKGVGSSELLDGVDGSDGSNRRVTFVVVPE